MQQSYQDLALLAASQLAKENSNLSYDFRWENGTLVINPTEQRNKVAVGLDSVVVTDKGIEGADPLLVSLLEKAVLQVAHPNDAREIGFRNAMEGRPAIEGISAAYAYGYELGTQNRIPAASDAKKTA